MSCFYCQRDGKECPVGYGTCHCGCGRKTNKAYDRVKRGIPKGTPYKFLRGHFDNRKLSAEDARTIRRRYVSENISQRQLAAEYGVVQSAISNVCMFRTHKDAGV